MFDNGCSMYMFLLLPQLKFAFVTPGPSLVGGGQGGPGPTQFLEQRKESQSRFASVVLDGVLGPLRLAQHT